MIDPLNYASFDPSINVFDGALAKHDLSKFIKKIYVAEFNLLFKFSFTQYAFLNPNMHEF